MFAARITLPHFSVSSAMSLPKSAGEPASAVPPRAERDALWRELEWTRQSRDELLQALQELRAATLARQKAEAALADLYRERAIARARGAEREPTQPMN
jgi:hypothetical protein